MNYLATIVTMLVISDGVIDPVVTPLFIGDEESCMDWRDRSYRAERFESRDRVSGRLMQSKDFVCALVDLESLQIPR